MSDESGSIWQALLSTGGYIATDADYEHGYDRRIREDLVRVVTFRVGDERHAVPIRQVREITRCFGTTPVPRTNDYITGVGTLRGELVPVLCLATRLGMAFLTFRLQRSLQHLFPKAHALHGHQWSFEQLVEAAGAEEELEELRANAGKAGR